MRVEIDQTADAASIQWAPRVSTQSQVVGRPGGRSVRLFFNAAGDVVGLEVLGWSQRATTPAEVQVVVHPTHAGEILEADHPLTRTLGEDVAEQSARNPAGRESASRAR